MGYKFTFKYIHFGKGANGKKKGKNVWCHSKDMLTAASCFLLKASRFGETSCCHSLLLI